ncbi:MAG: hypothetical protein JWN34_2019 [Bryobacterales bacterium]|nr:hypothetical protein [Bryobacterales bacterium]
MIEEGIQKLVQTDSAVAALCTAGGFMATLPKGTALPSWSYTTIHGAATPHLRGIDGLTEWEVQIDVFGSSPLSTLRLAKAITRVLDGYSGTLTDADATQVQECFWTSQHDFFDDAARTYRRMLEFSIWYASN